MTTHWDEYDMETTTQAFRDRWDAVAEHLPNFDGGLISESLEKGWTVAETVAQGREDDAEHAEAMGALASDYEFSVGRDMSMNY